MSVREREREKRLFLLRQSLFSFPLKLSPTVCLEEWTESAKCLAGMAPTASGTGKKTRAEYLSDDTKANLTLKQKQNLLL